MRRKGAGVRWTPLLKAEAPTEPAGETAVPDAAGMKFDTKRKPCREHGTGGSPAPVLDMGGGCGIIVSRLTISLLTKDRDECG